MSLSCLCAECLDRLSVADAGETVAAGGFNGVGGDASIEVSACGARQPQPRFRPPSLAGTSLEPGPDPRCRHYDGDSPVDLGNECLCGLRTSLKVPVERIRQFPGFASGK
jgi:hypothetical protein